MWWNTGRLGRWLAVSKSCSDSEVDLKEKIEAFWRVAGMPVRCMLRASTYHKTSSQRSGG